MTVVEKYLQAHAEKIRAAKEGDVRKAFELMDKADSLWGQMTTLAEKEEATEGRQRLHKEANL